MAAGPELLAALRQVIVLTPEGSAAHEATVTAVEQFSEREGMTLADWQPFTPPRPRPTLRIAGVAT